MCWPKTYSLNTIDRIETICILCFVSSHCSNSNYYLPNKKYSPNKKYYCSSLVNNSLNLSNDPSKIYIFKCYFLTRINCIMKMSHEPTLIWPGQSIWSYLGIIIWFITRSMGCTLKCYRGDYSPSRIRRIRNFSWMCLRGIVLHFIEFLVVTISLMLFLDFRTFKKLFLPKAIRFRQLF